MASLETIFKKILKPDAFNRYIHIKPLLNNNITIDSNNIIRLFNIIKNNYVNNHYIFNKVSNSYLQNIISVVKNWQDIKIIHHELNLVNNIYTFNTKYLKLYLLEPNNIDCTNLFQKIINIAFTLEKFSILNKFSNEHGTVYIFPINYNRDLFNKKFNNIDIDLLELENNYKALTIAGQVLPRNLNVFVIRNEECIKLFIHEIIHLFKLDISHNEILVNNIKFNCELIGGTFESYTELFSSILNTFFFIIRNNLDNYLLDLVKLEIIYGIYSSAKLLYLYDYNSSNFINFFNKKESSKTVKNNIPSIYYYIIKSMLFFCNNLWLKLIDNNLKIHSKFENLELYFINKCKCDQHYIDLFYKTMLIVEKNDDLSLSYIILDEQNNCSFLKASSRNKKYIIQLYNYVT
jgi:hypothetical protein